MQCALQDIPVYQFIRTNMGKLQYIPKSVDDTYANIYHYNGLFTAFFSMVPQIVSNGVFITSGAEVHIGHIRGAHPNVFSNMF